MASLDSLVGGSTTSMNLLSLPVELLEKTFSYLKYEDLGTCRLVCKTSDRVCQQLLNQGFSSAEKLHGQIYREIKAKLPRRESERRSHPLARHMDLLAAMETRLSLLAMTYIKYMEMGLCCFIPGKVLDEIYHILWRIRDDPTPPRPHELLTELRDISSMAMEHFEEKIIPVLKASIRQSEGQSRSLTHTDSDAGASRSAIDLNYPLPLPAGPSHSVMNTRVPPLRMEIVQLRNSLRSTSSTVLSLRKEVNDFKSVVSDQHRKMLEQDKKIIGLNRTVSDMNKKLADQSRRMQDFQNALLRLESHSEPHYTLTAATTPGRGPAPMMGDAKQRSCLIPGGGYMTDKASTSEKDVYIPQHGTSVAVDQHETADSLPQDDLAETVKRKNCDAYNLAKKQRTT